MRAMRAPKHLQPSTRDWFRQVVREFECESHHVRLLQAACEAWDRCQRAREELAEAGEYYKDNRGNMRPHPALNVERDSRLAFARLLRELGLDVAPPVEAPRPLELPANRRGKAG